MKDIYVQSVIELLRAGHDAEAVLAGLRSTMEKRGHSKLYGAVIRAVYRQLERGVSTAPTVRVVSTADSAKYAAEIAADMAALTTNAEPTIIEDTSIIGGYTVEHDHTLIDRSYKSALLHLYRKIAR